MKTRVERVTGDKRTIEFREWSKWLKAAGRLFDRYTDKWTNDDPFSYNETASVAFLAAAGATAGFITLAECVTEKHVLDEADPTKVTKRKRNGRADLWLHTTGEAQWAFEFKQRLGIGVSRADGRLSSWLIKAEDCAKQIYKGDGDMPVAGLILPLYYIDDEETARRAGEEIEAFAADRADYCWRLTPPGGRRAIYILFTLEERFRRWPGRSIER